MNEAVLQECQDVDDAIDYMDSLACMSTFHYSLDEVSGFSNTARALIRLYRRGYVCRARPTAPRAFQFPAYRLRPPQVRL